MEFEKSLQNNNVVIKKSTDQEILLYEVFDKYKYHWKWFVFCLILGLSVAYFYLRYTHDKYEVSTTIFINDNQSARLTTELSAFEDLGVRSGPTTSIINETGIIGSRSLINKVIKNLGLNITYHNVGEVMTTEIYGKEIPLRINFFVKDSVLYNLNTMFEITAISETNFVLKNSDNEIIEKIVFGKNIKMDFGEINITPTDNFTLDNGESLIIKINPLKKVARNYNRKIKIETKVRMSSLLLISLRDNVKQKAIDILDNLVVQYNKDAILYKTTISENTDDFINDRIADISSDLSIVDKGVEDFKIRNQITDLGLEASINLESNTQLQRRILELSSQLRLVEYLIEHLENNKNDLIPVNLGLQDDQSMNQNTSMYNMLIMERNRIIKSSSELNPTVINLESQLQTIRQSIKQSLLNLSSSINYMINEARNEEYRIGSKRTAAPKQEREYQDIKRKQLIIESLYLYLLEKREENAISLGIPVPNAKIIDLADGSNIPVLPMPKLAYLLGGLLGLVIPFAFISIRSLFDNKIHNSDEVEAIVKAPIIGEIPKIKTKKKIIKSDNMNSSISESFRLLRTNVSYMLSENKENSKTIFVSSTISGEGKTFIAINLASSLALLNNKILLIGSDIRKPKISSYLNLEFTRGLSHFLIDKNLEAPDIIESYKECNFDIIFAGDIPPNPSELLLNGRFEDILAYGKAHYDYIIVDTSPVSLVTDTLLLGKHADLFIYVVRADYTDKRILKFPKSMYENRRLPNMAMLVNGIDFKGKGYGYGHGYE